MNPFTQLIGPLLLVHLVVLLKGKGRSSTPRARLRNKAAQWTSLVIVSIVAWIFCVIGMLVIAVSITDDHSNVRLIIGLMQIVRDWIQDDVGLVSRTTDMSLVLLPIPIAALLTMVQQIRRKWPKSKE